MKVSIWLVLLTAIGTGMAAIGGYVGLSEYFSARPSVFLNIVDIAVVPRKPPKLASLLDRLRLIERRHKEYTSTDIIDLIDDLQRITDERGETNALGALPSELTEVIGSFREKRLDFDGLTQNLYSVAASLSEIETGREKLIEKLGALEKTYESVTELSILIFIHDLEQQSDTDFNVAQQKDNLVNLAGTFEDVSLNMEDLISDLQKVNDDADVKGDEKGSGNHLRVEVIFENHSRYKNDIYRKAMIAVSHDSDVQYFELDLSGEGQLAAYSLERKIFQSRPAEDMDKKKRELMGEFNHKADNFECNIGVFDLHRNIWTTENQACKDDGADLESLKSTLKPSR